MNNKMNNNKVQISKQPIAMKRNEITVTGPISEYKKNVTNFINNTLFGSDFGLVLTILVVLVGISFISIISFDNLGLIRSKYVNSTISIVFSIIFIWLIFKFMGNTFKFMEVELDIGYVIYVILIIALLVVFSG
jgi:uncharacterized BrkB/YihY/UPF0761 family membrane protein